MKKTEKIVLIIFAWGIFFKLMSWPMGGALVTISLMAYALLLFPGGFYLLSGNIKAEKSALPSALTGMALSIVPLGVLFKMHSGQEVNYILLQELFPP